MFATDERERDGVFRIYAVFSVPGTDRSTASSSRPGRRTISRSPRSRLISPPPIGMNARSGACSPSHPAGPSGPAQACVFMRRSLPVLIPFEKTGPFPNQISRRGGRGPPCKRSPHPFMEVDGEGIVEIPVGPVHAGIIEPGHFRFSAVGETIFFLEPRLSYTHKGTNSFSKRSGSARASSSRSAYRAPRLFRTGRRTAWRSSG